MSGKDRSRRITATEVLSDVIPWEQPHCRSPHRPLLPCCRFVQSRHLLRPARHCLPRRSRPTEELLPATFPPLAGASRSAFPVGRILPAFAAGPRGYLSYIPLFAIYGAPGRGSTVIPDVGLLG